VTRAPRKRLQHLLGHRAVAGADIEHLELRVAREGRRLDHRSQARPAFGIARHVVHDPIRDILVRVPIMRRRQPASRFARHCRPSLFSALLWRAQDILLRADPR
jgi:hypothetical protein